MPNIVAYFGFFPSNLTVAFETSNTPKGVRDEERPGLHRHGQFQHTRAGCGQAPWAQWWWCLRETHLRKGKMPEGERRGEQKKHPSQWRNRRGCSRHQSRYCSAGSAEDHGEAGCTSAVHGEFPHWSRQTCPEWSFYPCRNHTEAGFL